MIILEKDKYHQAIDPLAKVSFNNLFARSVVEHNVQGEVYVDAPETPKTFYVVHPYGMSLLFGECHNAEFNKQFKDYALNVNKSRLKNEWMQAFPNDWDAVLNELFAGRMVRSGENAKNEDRRIIELNTRINFKFNKTRYLQTRAINTDFEIVRIDEKIFDEMRGSVVPAAFWDSAEDFTTKGAGFSILINNSIAATAFSSFVHGDKFELGIETVEKFRDAGLALYACSALIDYCLENNSEPLWACRLENTGSYKLALKLGFEPVIEIPYYRLSQ